MLQLITFKIPQHSGWQAQFLVDYFKNRNKVKSSKNIPRSKSADNVSLNISTALNWQKWKGTISMLNTQSENLERRHSFCYSVLSLRKIVICRRIVGAYPNLFHFVTLNKFEKNSNLTSFQLKIMLFFSSDLKSVNICHIEVN